MKERRRVVAAIALSGLLAAGLTVAQPGVATASPPGEAWEPPADAASGDIPDVNAPEEDWAPHTGGRFGVEESEDGPEEGRVQLFAAPQDVTAAAPGVGELPWFSFHDVAVSTDTLAQVNIANGNLLLTANDLDIAAPGYGLRADRFYNGLTEDAGKLGGGWKSSIAEFDVGLERVDDRVDFYAPNGFVARFDQTESGFAQPDGLNAKLTHDPEGGDEAYELEYNRTGEKLRFSRSGYLTRTEDRNGVGSWYTYSEGRIVSVYHDNGRGFRVLEDRDDGSVTKGIEDTAGRATLFEYDGERRLNAVSAADGASTRYSYDAEGRIDRITVDGAVTGQDIAFSYDSEHRVVEISETQASPTWGTSDRITTAFSYEDGSTTVTDANGGESSFDIDELGRVVGATDQLDRERSQEWTTNSDIASTVDALGSGDQLNTTTYSYDGEANRTDAELPTGAAAAAAFQVGTGCDAPDTGTAYQAKCSTDEAGNSKEYEYDEAGNVTKQTDSSGEGGAAEFERTYNGDGDTDCGGFDGQICSTTDGNDATTSYSYNDDGDLLRVTPPGDLGETRYSHDSLGRVTNVTDGNGDITRYLYDVRDRLISTVYDSSGTVRTTYYDSGLEESVVDSAGGTKSFEYDAQGRVTKESGPDAGEEQTYKYDKVGNLTELENEFGRTTYRYDEANQLEAVTEPGGNCPEDAAPGNLSGCIAFEYDANGAETSRLLPGGATIDTERDRTGRAVRITASDTRGQAVFDVEYDYQDADSDEDRAKIQAKTSHKEEGVREGAVTAYEYDTRGRLTSAVETLDGAETASWTYAYDDAGNRTEQTRSGDTGAEAGTIEYEYDAANRLVSESGDEADWEYDGAGNQTKRGSDGVPSSYGDRSQVTDIGDAEFETFAGGNDVRTRAGNIRTWFTELGVTSHQRSSHPIVRFTHSPDGQALAYKRGVSHYYVHDGLGSVVGMFTPRGVWEGGYSYSPYGETRSMTAGDPTQVNPLRYIGELQDANGLYKLGARYYDPEQGRFTQYDPSGQEASPYAYGAGDPINNADPSGLAAVTAEVEACYYVCVGVGVASDSEGRTALTGSLGAGTPSVSGSVGATTGDAQSGLGASASCSAGPVSASVSEGGDISGSVGTSAATPGCSVTANGQVQIS